MSGRRVSPAVRCIDGRWSCVARFDAIVFPEGRAGSVLASASWFRAAICEVTAIHEKESCECCTRHYSQREKCREGYARAGG
jgi:hypothetical protein